MDYPEIYAVDFDGTLNTARTYPELGAPNVDLFEFLKERRAAGDKIILWTCREGELLKAAVKYCVNYGLSFDAVNDNMPENIKYFENNCRKIWAHHYIDDRNTTGTVVLRSRLLREMMELLSEKIKDSEEVIEEYKGGSDLIGQNMAYACYSMASEIKEKFESIFYENAEVITNNGRNKEKRAEMERLTREETIVVRGEEMAACNYKNNDCNDSCMYGRCRWQEKANMLLKEYEDTGHTPKQIRKLVDRDTAKEPQYEGDGYSEGEMVYDIWICPNCGTKYEVDYDDYKFCPECGQRIKRGK